MDGDRTLAELAERYGYSDLRLLGRQFRQVMGLPPGRFRARCRG
jgi:AraC-like DNA-binding protein